MAKVLYRAATPFVPATSHRPSLTILRSYPAVLPGAGPLLGHQRGHERDFCGDGNAPGGGQHCGNHLRPVRQAGRPPAATLRFVRIDAGPLTCPSRPLAPFCRLCWTWSPTTSRAASTARPELWPSAEPRTAPSARAAPTKTRPTGPSATAGRIHWPFLAFCEVNIDDCASQPCYNGTCRDQEQGYSCSCPSGYSGLQCQEEQSSCIGTTCNDRSMCKNEPGYGQFICLCRTGYTGANCSSTLDPCAANPCANSAQCVPLGRFKCVCRAGWEGPLCADNIDDCAESPCLLGSNCTNLIDDVACSCPAEFTGKRCETKVDMCRGPPSPCGEHGTCVDIFFSPLCLYKAGWMGPNCTVQVDECSSNPCLNGGQCQDVEGAGTDRCLDQVNKYHCQCRPGFRAEVRKGHQFLPVAAVSEQRQLHQLAGQFLLRLPVRH